MGRWLRRSGLSRLLRRRRGRPGELRRPLRRPAARVIGWAARGRQGPGGGGHPGGIRRVAHRRRVRTRPRSALAWLSPGPTDGRHRVRSSHAPVPGRGVEARLPSGLRVTAEVAEGRWEGPGASDLDELTPPSAGDRVAFSKGHPPGGIGDMGVPGPAKTRIGTGYERCASVGRAGERTTGTGRSRGGASLPPALPPRRRRRPRRAAFERHWHLGGLSAGGRRAA